MMGMERVKKGTKILRSGIARKENEIINSSLHFLFIGCFHFMCAFSIYIPTLSPSAYFHSRVFTEPKTISLLHYVLPQYLVYRKHSIVRSVIINL